MVTALPATEKHRSLRFHRSLKSLVQYLVLPCCGFQPGWQVDSIAGSLSPENQVIVTFYQREKGGEMNLVIEEPNNAKSNSEARILLHLVFGNIPLVFADVKWDDSTRISLECNEVEGENSSDLLSARTWNAFFDGTKGFATSKTTTAPPDAEILGLLRPTTTSMGLLPLETGNINYKRAPFKHIQDKRNKTDFATFSTVDPNGPSIYFFRSFPAK